MTDDMRPDIGYGPPGNLNEHVKGDLIRFDVVRTMLLRDVLRADECETLAERYDWLRHRVLDFCMPQGGTFPDGAFVDTRKESA